MAEDESRLTGMTLTKLGLGADYYSNTSPSVSRILMNEIYKMKEYLNKAEPSGATLGACNHCGQVFRPENHTVSILPRLKLNKKVKQLLRDKNKLKKHSFSSHLLENYQSGYNVMRKMCGCCGRTTRSKLYSRSDRAHHLRQTHSNTQPLKELPKLTKSQKKKQKAKKKLKERPTTGVAGGEPAHVKNTSDIKSALHSSNTLQTSRVHTESLTQLAPSSTLRKGSPSSPITGHRHTDIPPSSRQSAYHRGDGSKGQQSSLSVVRPDKSIKKNRKSLSTLQRMLSDAQRDKDKQSGSTGSVLKNFLGSL